MPGIKDNHRSSRIRRGFCRNLRTAMRKHIAARDAECDQRKNDRHAAEDFFHACFHLLPPHKEDLVQMYAVRNENMQIALWQKARDSVTVNHEHNLC